MYPYWVSVAVPITVLLYDPPVITNWTLLIPSGELADRVERRAGPARSAPLEGTSTEVDGAGSTVSVNGWVAILLLASVAVMVIG